jgi:type II secretory pathway pseudopilin PulG
VTLKQNNTASPGVSAPPRNGEQGYVLVVLIFFAALLLVGTTVILRRATFEGRREREEELIFRGMQYQRAIQLYFRKFARYPTSLDDLEKTNGIRFLRKRYSDPMTKEGKWRLIHLGPGGVFVDSLNSGAQPKALAGTSPSGANPPPQGSASGGPTQPGSPPSTGPAPSQGPGQPAPFGLSPFSTGTPPAAQPAQGGGASGNPPNEPAFSPSANPGANSLLQGRAAVPGQQPGQQPASGTTDSSAPPASSAPQPGTSSPVFGGGAIAGFASMSKAESIKTLNGYNEYDKWEFIFDYRQDPIAAAALGRLGGQQAQPAPQVPGQPPPQNQPPTQPQNPFGNLPPGSINSPGTPSQPPQPGSGTSPFSPTPGFLPPPRTR